MKLQVQRGEPYEFSRRRLEGMLRRWWRHERVVPQMHLARRRPPYEDIGPSDHVATLCYSKSATMKQLRRSFAAAALAERAKDIFPVTLIHTIVAKPRSMIAMPTICHNTEKISRCDVARLQRRPSQPMKESTG